MQRKEEEEGLVVRVRAWWPTVRSLPWAAAVRKERGGGGGRQIWRNFVTPEEEAAALCLYGTLNLFTRRTRAEI